MVQTYVIREERDRLLALKAVQRARLGQQVRISKPDRSAEQNRLLHGRLNDLADQLAWPPDTGEIHDMEFWKRRCTLQWLIDSKESPEVITALEGDEFGLLIPHTSDLTTEQFASLCTWVEAFGAQHGVVFKEPGGPEPPPPDPRDYR